MTFNKIPKHRALYHALIESILKDKDVMDEGTETSKKTSAIKDSSKGKSLTTSLKSAKFGKSTKDQVVELISVQDYDNAEHDDAELDNTDMPIDQGEDVGNTYEQPNDEVILKNDWYKKSSSGTSPDPEWNEGKSVDDKPEQSWLNDMAKDIKPPLTFDELMHTPIDFSAFAMNSLKIDNLRKEIVVRPAYNLLKRTCKSYMELDYTMEEGYRALSEQIDWNNPEGHRSDFFFNNDLEYLRGGSNDKKYTASTIKSKAARYELKGIEDVVPNLWSPVKHDVYLTKRILSIISVKVNKWYEYGHLEEIVVKRADQNLYTFKEVNLHMFARRMVIQARVKDLQLGIESYQKKLNLTKPRTRDVDMSRRPANTKLLSGIEDSHHGPSDAMHNPSQPLKEEIYVAQLDGFVDPDHPEKVYRLRKVLYGLKQALRASYNEISNFLMCKGFTKDADHVGCIDTRKSTSRGIQFLGDKLVSWMSKKQDCTTMSSAEAEYVVLSASCVQVMWMRTQLKDYGFNYNKIPLYYDSQSAIAISCNPM
ncbi:putative reverse transcriptase domain-containing protein [Tanacetum coccineum]|uniref:Reverse transcriptase domain-containing protein n=1 Tax=Tanacetum coccineum TaxID=301880 RepID=A0ABQ5H7W5_9ASTR